MFTVNIDPKCIKKTSKKYRKKQHFSHLVALGRGLVIKKITNRYALFILYHLESCTSDYAFLLCVCIFFHLQCLIIVVTLSLFPNSCMLDDDEYDSLIFRFFFQLTKYLPKYFSLENSIFKLWSLNLNLIILFPYFFFIID